jgi:hypothetical protein
MFQSLGIGIRLRLLRSGERDLALRPSGPAEEAIRSGDGGAFEAVSAFALSVGDNDASIENLEAEIASIHAVDASAREPEELDRVEQLVIFMCCFFATPLRVRPPARSSELVR